MFAGGAHQECLNFNHGTPWEPAHREYSLTVAAGAFLRPGATERGGGGSLSIEEGAFKLSFPGAARGNEQKTIIVYSHPSSPHHLLGRDFIHHLAALPLS